MLKTTTMMVGSQSNFEFIRKKHEVLCKKTRLKNYKNPNVEIIMAPQYNFRNVVNELCDSALLIMHFKIPTNISELRSKRKFFGRKRSFNNLCLIMIIFTTLIETINLTAALNVYVNSTIVQYNNDNNNDNNSNSNRYNNRPVSDRQQEENDRRLTEVAKSAPINQTAVLERTRKSLVDASGEDLLKLHRIVMQGLGLKSLPNMAKANISQEEYRDKYEEYLKRVHQRNKREAFLGLEEFPPSRKQLFVYSHNSSHQKGESQNISHSRHRRSLITGNGSGNGMVYLRFPIDEPISTEETEATRRSDETPTDIEEATLKILIVFDGWRMETLHSSPEYLVLKVYELTEPYGLIWLDSQQIDLWKMSAESRTTTSHWLQFDVGRAVEGWLSGRHTNLGLEVHCDGCQQAGARIVQDATRNTNEARFTPVLNIIGRDAAGQHREKRSRQHHLMPAIKRRPRKTDCYPENQKCCRHSMEVVFKEIKGFEFIIQPKIFDAGYCKGKCPPRYNPAHHHAVLQSLIWKQDKSRAPRPCCAPSKLVELEVLHVDEKDSRKLRVSTWADMRVLECACS